MPEHVAIGSRRVPYADEALRCHRVPLSDGRTALIDSVDADRVGQRSWWIRWTRTSGQRSACHVRSNREALYHLVLGRDVERVIYLNLDPLDCRRANLLPCGPSELNHNRPKTSRSVTSAFKGVQWDGRREKWRATITVYRTRRHLGRFSDERSAAEAYDAAAAENFGEFARLNFPASSHP